jgi:hypothetical protein
MLILFDKSFIAKVKNNRNVIFYFLPDKPTKITTRITNGVIANVHSTHLYRVYKYPAFTYQAVTLCFKLQYT